MRARGRGPAEHDRLVELVYDAADTEGAWADVVSSFARWLGAEKAHMFVLGDGGAVVESHYLQYDPALIEGYHAHYHLMDPRLKLAMENPGRVISDVEAIPPAELERSEFYNEFMTRVGDRYTLFLNLPVGDGTLSPQAFMRPPTRAPFDRQDVEDWSRILPHVKRAIRLRNLLRSTRARLFDLQAALDTLELPIAVLDGFGRVQCISTRAEALLAKWPALCVRQQRLTAERPRDSMAIAAAISEAAMLADPARVRRAGGLGSPPAVEIEREEGRPLGLVFMPLRPRHALRAQGSVRARVLVVFHDPDALIRVNPDLVARLHGLTPTEAALAAAIAEGSSLTEFAEQRGCSEQTARTHLKRVLDKTQTRRQAELVRLMLGSAALHVTNDES